MSEQILRELRLSIAWLRRERDQARHERDTALVELERVRADLHMAEKWRDNYKTAWEKSTGQTNRG